MADLISSLGQYMFAQADPPANTSTPAALTLAGTPDTIDVAAVPMIKNGAVVGVILVGSPAAGDTLTAQVFKNGSAMSGVTVTVTSAAANASAVFSKDLAANQFLAGDLLSLRYTTSTGGTYSVRDIVGVIVVQFGLSE